MSKPMLALFGAALAVVAFALGHYAASPSATEPEARPARSTEGGGPLVESPDAAREALLELLRDPDPYRRASGLGELLPRLGPEAVPAIRAVLDEPFLDIAGTEVLLLVRRWSEDDPEAAFIWVRNGAELGYAAAALDLAVEQRASVDPRTTLQTIRGLGRAPYSKALQMALVRGWLASDDPALEDYIRSLGMGFERQRAIQVLVHQRLLRDGPEETMRWAEAIPEYDDHRYKLNVFRRLGGDLARLDPKLAVAWCEKHCGGPYGNNVRNWVIQGWAKTDGPAAMEWASQAPPAEREMAVRDAFRYWRRDDVDGLQSWFDTQNPEELEPWLMPVASNYANLLAQEKDPHEGIAWAMRLKNQEKRDEALIQIARRWRSQDAKAAEEWLAESPLSEEQRATVLESPLNKRPKKAPPSAGSDTSTAGEDPA